MEVLIHLTESEMRNLSRSFLDDYDKFKTVRCPVCGAVIPDEDIQDTCPHCGNHIVFKRVYYV